MSWSKWYSVSDGKAGLGTSVTALRMGDKDFMVFVADPTGEVFFTSGNADDGFGQWSPVGRERRDGVGTPAIAGPGTSVTALPLDGERFVLFIADPAGEVLFTSGNAHDGFAAWHTVSQGQAGPGVSVAAVRIGEKFFLFLANPVGVVFVSSGKPDTHWSGWSSVAEGLAAPRTSVTALPMSPNSFALFLADPPGGVFATAGGDHWKTVSQGAARADTRVTAVPRGEGFVLFVTDPNGGVYTVSGRPPDDWEEWTPVRDVRALPGTSVTAVPIDGNRFAVFVPDLLGDIRATSGKPPSDWCQWSHVPGGRARPGSSVTAIPIGGDRCTLFCVDPDGGVFTVSGAPTLYSPFVEAYSVDFANGNRHPHVNLNGWPDMDFSPVTDADHAQRVSDPEGIVLALTRDWLARKTALNSVYVKLPASGKQSVLLESRLLMRVTFDVPQAKGLQSPPAHGSTPEPWAVALNVSPVDAIPPPITVPATQMVNVTCQFHRKDQLSGVRLNTPGALQPDGPAHLESPLNYGDYQASSIAPPALFTLEHWFCGKGLAGNKHIPGGCSLKISRGAQCEGIDQRVYSSDVLSAAAASTSTIGALGVSLVTKDGFGRISVRLRTFSIWINRGP